MLHLDPPTKYFWFYGPADFRKGFDCLCGLMKDLPRTVVTDGGVYIFVNRCRNAIKLIK
jgi:hypothetical protein